MRRLVVFGIVLVIGFVISIFTVSREDVRKFNDKLVDIAAAVDGQYGPFVQDLDRYRSGGSVNVAGMRSKIDAIDKALDSNLEKLAAVKSPDDELCKKLLKSVNDYVAHGRTCTATYRKVCDYMDQHNPPTEEDIQKIDEMMAEMAAKDEQLFNQVGMMQRSMAEKHKMELK